MPNPTFVLVSLVKIDGTVCSPQPQQRLELQNDGESYDKAPESPDNFDVCRLLAVKDNGTIINWELSVRYWGSTYTCNALYRQANPSGTPAPDANYCGWDSSQVDCTLYEASVVNDDF